jgi:hypothetical protein
MRRSGSIEPTLDKVGPENLHDCGIGCVTSLKHQGHAPKSEWLQRRFAEGLRFLLFRDNKGKPLAFLEYVPGEFAWRPVNAMGWLFVHCLWVYSAGKKIGGLGSRLIEACIEEARQVGAQGVAAMVSDGPWMAPKQVFLRNGFVEIAERDRFQLVAYRLGKGPDPTFRDISDKYTSQKGLHIVYAAQCPMLPKSVADVSEMAAEQGLDVTVTVLDTAREAQRAPSYYGVFNLSWNGRLLSDHYVSKGRFRNILKKEIFDQP